MNIKHFFGEDQQPNTSTCGHSLLVDGVALEEKRQYLHPLTALLVSVGSMDPHLIFVRATLAPYPNDSIYTDQTITKISSSYWQ